MSKHRFATHLKHGLSRKAIFLFLYVLGVTIISVTAPANAVTDVFEVTNVPVDATADSAAAARESALSSGQRQAFILLLQRLTLREHHSVLPIPDADTVSTYVRDFSVSDEKTSSVRYLAKLHVRFKSADVRALLNEFGLPFAETTSKPTVVLPVLEYNGALMLWEDVNQWRDAWLKQSISTGLTPLIHPVGDIADIDSIGARHAIDGDTARLQRIAGRYETAPVTVAHAVLNSSAFSDLTSLDVYVTRYAGSTEPLTQVMTFSAPATEPVETLLANAAVHTAAFIEDSWKQENLMRAGERGVLAVSIPITSLSQWLGIKRNMAGIAVIDRLDMVLLSRDEVRLNIHFLGDVRQLTTALAQADLRLDQLEGVWTVTALK